MIWPIRMQLMTHYRIPEMTESLVGKASNCFDSESAYRLVQIASEQIFDKEWKSKSEKISREKTSSIRFLKLQIKVHRNLAFSKFNSTEFELHKTTQEQRILPVLSGKFRYFVSCSKKSTLPKISSCGQHSAHCGV